MRGLNSYPFVQEMTCFCVSPHVHYRRYNWSLSDHIQRQFNPVYFFATYCLQIRFNSILLSQVVPSFDVFQPKLNMHFMFTPCKIKFEITIPIVLNGSLCDQNIASCNELKFSEDYACSGVCVCVCV